VFQEKKTQLLRKFKVSALLFSDCKWFQNDHLQNHYRRSRNMHLNIFANDYILFLLQISANTTASVTACLAPAHTDQLTIIWQNRLFFNSQHKIGNSKYPAL